MRSDIINNNSKAYGGNAEGIVNVPDAATYTVLAADSGKVHVMPDLTATCTITLPTEKAGLTFKFWYCAAAIDAHNWVINTTGNSNYYVGGVGHADTTADDNAESLFADGNSESALTIVKPGTGSWVEIVCDGLLWYLNGMVVGADIPTIADQ